MKKSSRPDEISSGLNGRRGRSISIAMLLILVVLISAGSGVYAGASFFAQQAPGVTVTTTLFTTTTSWTTSTIWSTVTSVVQGILTTVEYTTSTSTVTVTGSTSYRTAKTVTAHGNALITTAQSKFGGASGLFHGSGDYLSTPDSADWYFGTGDFTIDFWVRFNSVNTYQGFFSVYDRGSSQMFLELQNNGGMRFYARDSGGVKLDNTWTPSPALATGTWYHMALVRSGSSFYFFIGGSQVGSVYADSDAVPDYTTSFLIGVSEGGFAYLNGWLDEFRVSKGVARWTSNFTPPTSAYTGDSNIVLLLHMDGADGSTTFIDSP